MNWISYHLFAPQPYYDFLKDIVAPFLKENEVTIEKYFFIRFWVVEGGFHIRLRILTEDESMKEKIETYFSKFLDKEKIQRAIYKPETTRYGGGTGVRISEEFFHISSKYVLEAMKSEEEWTEEISLGNGVFMGTAILQALGTEDLDHKYFWNKFKNYWKYRISNYRPMELLYDEQKDDLSTYLETIYNGLKENNLDGWHGDFYSQLLVLRSDYRNFKMDDFKLLNSYIHMNNNRLGIFAMEEVYMAFLLGKGGREDNTIGGF